VEHNRQGLVNGRGCKSCPPHGPHVVEAASDGSYVAHCLACGLVPYAKIAWRRRWRSTKPGARTLALIHPTLGRGFLWSSP
jgi:hypothetical protein